MPRTARIFQRALCYHIMNRAIDRRTVFADDEDRAHFSGLVSDYKLTCGAAVYHWAWMESHYHMLIEVVFDNLRPFVGGLQQAYAQYYPRRHGTCGVFWQGRFKSKPVEIGEYLARCGRYIERNPVRAGIVTDAWEHPWSSANAYVRGRADGLTDLNGHLGAPDGWTAADREMYAAALRKSDDDAWMRRYRRTGTIGSVSFTGQLKKQHGRYRRRRGRPVKRQT